MGKREVVTEVRVIVDVPEERWAMRRTEDTDAEYAARLHQRRMDRASELVANIKRHCDLEGVAYVDTVREARCEHCGYDWTEASSVYNGGCCDADEAANPEPRDDACRAGPAELIDSARLDALAAQVGRVERAVRELASMPDIAPSHRRTLAILNDGGPDAPA